MSASIPPHLTCLAYYDHAPAPIYQLQINQLIQEEIQRNDNEDKMDTNDTMDPYSYNATQHPLLHELAQKHLNKGSNPPPQTDVFSPEERRRIDLVYKALEYRNLSLLKEFPKEQYPVYLDALQGVKDSLQRRLESLREQSLAVNRERKTKNTALGQTLDRLEMELRTLRVEEDAMRLETSIMKRQVERLREIASNVNQDDEHMQDVSR